MVSRENHLKRQQWISFLEQWRNSGQSIPDWCKEKRISTRVFYYWKRKLAQTPSHKKSELFQEIKEEIRSQEIDSGIFIEWLPLTIRLSKTYDPQVLSQLLVQIRSLKC